ncbi:MAG: NnrS family protein [Nitrospirae bacterium]|nr:NnrS family protein [Nitrospirota bacterium]
MIYLLVSFGAAFRLLVPVIESSTTLLLSIATIGWSGAYLLFAVVYGPFLLKPNLDNE